MKGITVNGVTPWMIGTATKVIFDSMTLDDRNFEVAAPPMATRSPF